MQSVLTILLTIYLADSVFAFVHPAQSLCHPSAQRERMNNSCRVGPRYHHKLSSTSASSRQGLFVALNDDSQSPPSLIIEDIIAGSGPAASPGDIVTVKYTGRLQSSGKQFDAGTITFKLGAGRVIPGWDQGIESMQAGGGSRKLIIPPDLAYGRSGAGGGIIPPNATLEFDVELVGISNGPLAEVMAATGIGPNPRTALLVGAVLY